MHAYASIHSTLLTNTTHQWASGRRPRPPRPPAWSYRRQSPLESHTCAHSHTQPVRLSVTPDPVRLKTAPSLSGRLTPSMVHLLIAAMLTCPSRPSSFIAIVPGLFRSSLSVGALFPSSFLSLFFPPLPLPHVCVCIDIALLVLPARFFRQLACYLSLYWFLRLSLSACCCLSRPCSHSLLFLCLSSLFLSLSLFFPLSLLSPSPLARPPSMCVSELIFLSLFLCFSFPLFRSLLLFLFLSFYM